MSSKIRSTLELMNILSKDDEIPYFAEEVDTRYLCTSCNKLMMTVSLAPCGHRFCGKCVEKLKGTAKCPMKDKECQSLKFSLLRDPGTTRDIAKLKVRCIFGDCTEIMPLSNWAIHKVGCTHRVVPCVNKQYGCDDNLQNANIKEHVEFDCKCVPCPLFELCKFKGKHESVRNHQSNLVDHLVPIIKRQSYLEAENIQLRKDCELLQKENRICKTRHEKQGLVNVKQSIPKSGNDDEYHKEPISSTSSMNTSQIAVDRSEIQTVRYEIDNVKLQVQLMETTSYDGTLIWKIQNYMGHIEHAKRGTSRSLYSQPFFTSRHGYKLCARAYMNGDRDGEGSWISLYIVIMKGVYDELLQWPFPYNIDVELLVPKSNEVRDIQPIKNTIVPNDADCFAKPTKLKNKGNGFSEFVRHVDLNKYAGDDALFFKIKVNCGHTQ